MASRQNVSDHGDDDDIGVGDNGNDYNDDDGLAIAETVKIMTLMKIMAISDLFSTRLPAHILSRPAPLKTKNVNVDVTSSLSIIKIVIST